MATHAGRTKAQETAYRKRHKEHINKRKREWQQTPSAKKSQREYYTKLRAKAIAGYGARCVCCGNEYPSHLTIDHVGGNGKQDRDGRQVAFYKQIIRDEFPPRYQILCLNCNMAKHLLGRCECSDARTQSR